VPMMESTARRRGCEEDREGAQRAPPGAAEELRREEGAAPSSRRASSAALQARRPRTRAGEGPSGLRPPPRNFARPTLLLRPLSFLLVGEPWPGPTPLPLPAMLLPTAPSDLGGGMAEVARGGRGKGGVKKI
jgi:hypothetical protein